jgi:hypothetical protein
MHTFNPRSILVLIIVAAGVYLASVALADDFKAINGKEYKNASVIRVEPDGITVKFSGGIVKIPFTELSEELKEKYHYNPEAAQKFAADSAAQMNRLNTVVAPKTESRKEAENNADGHVQQVMIFAIIKPYIYGERQTTAYIQQYEKYWAGPTIYDFEWRKVGEQFTGVIDEPMPQSFETGDSAVVTLYKIGHSDDSSRYPLFRVLFR